MIPHGIKIIGAGTFYEMNFTLFHLKDVKPIETVVIPASVRRINYNAFDSCENLRNSMETPIEYNRYENGYYYTEEFELKL